MRKFRMLALAQCVPALPGLAGPKTYAPSPVWSGSTTKPVKFFPMNRAEVNRWHHLAKKWFRTTLADLLKRSGLSWRYVIAVYMALREDFINYETGLLDPSHAAIAGAIGGGERHVRRALKFLQDLRVIARIRRSDQEKNGEGRLVWRQETNAYFLLPPSQWVGFDAPPPAPPPEPGTWGDHSCGQREPHTEAVAMGREAKAAGREPAMAETVKVLELDTDRNSLASVLARLGRANLEADANAAKPRDLPGGRDGRETSSSCFSLGSRPPNST